MIEHSLGDCDMSTAIDHIQEIESFLGGIGENEDKLTPVQMLKYKELNREMVEDIPKMVKDCNCKKL